MDVRFAGALLATGTGGLREEEVLAALDERESVARALDGAEAGRGEGVVTPFFADDLTLGSRARPVARALVAACRYGPSLGYYPSAAKSWCVLPAADEAAARAAHAKEGVTTQYTRGH